MNIRKEKLNCDPQMTLSTLKNVREEGNKPLKDYKSWGWGSWGRTLAQVRP
jgi:hypothetical protein